MLFIVCIHFMPDRVMTDLDSICFKICFLSMKQLTARSGRSQAQLAVLGSSPRHSSCLVVELQDRWRSITNGLRDKAARRWNMMFYCLRMQAFGIETCREDIKSSMT